MVYICLFLLLVCLFYSVYSVEKKIFFAISLKLVGISLWLFVIFALISKFSIYRAVYFTNIDSVFFNSIVRLSASIFDLVKINNIGILAYCLSTILFLFTYSNFKYYRLAAALGIVCVAIIYINAPILFRQRLYNYITMHSTYINVDVASEIINIINLMFLLCLMILPYIILLTDYFSQPFIRQKRKALRIAFIYFMNDFWSILIIFCSDLRHYFYINCGLLYYPHQVNAIEILPIIIIFSAFCATFIPIITGIFFPPKLHFKFQNSEEIHNTNESLYMILHTFKNAFVSICRYSNDDTNGIFSNEMRLETINSIAREQLVNLSNTIDALNETQTTFRQQTKLNAIELVKDAICQSGAASKAKITETYAADNPYVLANKPQLEECFICILNNSIDALNGRNNPRISISLVSDSSYVYIEFRDNGCGIKNPRLAFHPLYSTKKGGNNFGIGLTNTQKYIKSLHGFIDIKSKPGKFTSVQIVLPLIKKQEALING